MDRTRVGTGTERLRAAVAAAARMHLEEAVPYLIALYDEPTAGVGAKNIAAFNVAQLAPEYSKPFLLEVLKDDTLAVEGYDRSAHAFVAAALVDMGEPAG